MNEDVVFKGSRAGLQLVFNEAVEFSGIVEQVKSKLESALHFFGEGTTVHIAADKITREQERVLSELFQSYGLRLQAVDAAARAAAAAKRKAGETEPLPEIMRVDRTVRNGQEIICNGSVVICGNVNPGAKIIAGGNIEVRGTCRGIVHAGAFGNTEAIVVAERMMAMQIRIADLIARAPDQLEKAECAEYACIKDGNIVIEPVNKQEVC